jgi:hypothetical protein
VDADELPGLEGRPTLVERFEERRDARILRSAAF